jgi:L-malate glycosyltransferase
MTSKKTKKILVLCPHPEGHVPGQRLKYEQYFEHWRNNGFEVTVQSFFSVATQQVLYKKGHFFQKALGTLGGYLRRIGQLFTIGRYDVVYVFLWVTPLGPAMMEWLVSRLAKKMVYDIDDLVYIRHSGAEPWYALLLKGRNKPMLLMKRAHHVITCTPYLDEYARRFNQHTTDISSTINTVTYTPVNDYANTDPIVLGWSGSHSTIRMLKTIAPVFLELKKHIDFKLLIMGSTDFELPGIEVETTEWSEAKEIPTLQRIDIGLYPLPNEEWVLGKSGLKALQYMALGIPPVATNIGCNNRVIEDGVSGFLVNTHEEWIEKLLLLARNPQLRAQMGQAARQRVEQYYSIKANEPVYLSILQSVAEGR